MHPTLVLPNYSILYHSGCCRLSALANASLATVVVTVRADLIVFVTHLGPPYGLNLPTVDKVIPSQQPAATARDIEILTWSRPVLLGSNIIRSQRTALTHVPPHRIIDATKKTHFIQLIWGLLVGGTSCPHSVRVPARRRTGGFCTVRYGSDNGIYRRQLGTLYTTIVSHLSY